ncbi:MAG: hypothetical protein C0424_09010 [Sphingobacteriaceae bacterium]|nr:hypothetical protein [Sphingobacteriaceae bacterium]
MSLKQILYPTKVQPVLWLFAAVLLSHCGRVYHAPMNQQVTLFREAGEASVQAAYGRISEDGRAADLQGAWAITKRLAMQVNLQAAWGFDDGDRTLHAARGGQMSAGLGYYRPLGRYWVVENYAGLGMSYQRHFFPLSWFNSSEYISSTYGQGNGAIPRNSEFDFRGLYAYTQPAIGFRWKYFEAALSTNIQYGNTMFAGSRNVSLRDGGMVSTKDNHRVFLAEPAFTLRLVFPHVKIQTQMVLVREFTQSGLRMPTERISIGIFVPIKR